MNKLRLYIILVIAIFFSAAYLANKKNDEHVKNAAFTEMYVPIWNQGKAQVIELAEAMPEDKFSFKPAEESKTFAEQIVHIAASSHIMAQMILKGEKVEYKEPDASTMSKEEIIEFTEKELSATADIIESLSEKELKTEIKSFGGNMMPKQQAVIFIHDHLTNHKAKANLYIRMNGIDPPKYRYY
ncbi:MAG: hypothetical protein CMO01_08385 [Thalassobius sp.]|nr:hypothetical protein [Thalassovita sp.]